MPRRHSRQRVARPIFLPLKSLTTRRQHTVQRWTSGEQSFPRWHCLKHTVVCASCISCGPRFLCDLDPSFLAHWPKSHTGLLNSVLHCRAMGVLVFFMLSGYYPFDDESIPVMFRNIKKGRYLLVYLSPTMSSLSSTVHQCLFFSLAPHFALLTWSWCPNMVLLLTWSLCGIKV